MQVLVDERIDDPEYVLILEKIVEHARKVLQFQLVRVAFGIVDRTFVGREQVGRSRGQLLGLHLNIHRYDLRLFVYPLEYDGSVHQLGRCRVFLGIDRIGER